MVYTRSISVALWQVLDVMDYRLIRAVRLYTSYDRRLSVKSNIGILIKVDRYRYQIVFNN